MMMSFVISALLLAGLLLWYKRYLSENYSTVDRPYKRWLPIAFISIFFVGFNMLINNPPDAIVAAFKSKKYLDPDAQFQIGSAYYLGRDLPKDDTQALYWLTFAASQGHEQAKELIMLLGGSKQATVTSAESQPSTTSSTESTGSSKGNMIGFGIELLRSDDIKTRLTDIAGMSEAKENVKRFLELIQNSERYTEMGAKPPKGFIIYGPPGTGKTLIARAIAGEAGINFLSVSGAAFKESYVGIGAARIRELFATARKYKPAIIFIDEIDALAPARNAESSPEDIQTVNQLLSEMENLNPESNKDIYVVGATNRIDSLDSALLRPGRFDWQIDIPLPNETDRVDILKLYLKSIKAGDKLNVLDLAIKSAGYSGADLKNLVNEAAIIAVNQNKKEVDMAAFDEAFTKIAKYESALSPTLSVSILSASEVNASFKDIAGMNEAKTEVTEIVDFLANPEKFERLGAKAPNGVIIYGPPGTGKTLMARAIAGEAKVAFLSVSGSAFDEKFVGVGAARVRELFKLARRYKPCVVFIDEIDALAPKRSSEDISGRDQTINQFLNEMDNVHKTLNEGIVFIGATNRLEGMDEAVLRPGRFDRKVFFRLPNAMERQEILELVMKKIKLAPDVNSKSLAQLTPGFSGADLTNLVNEAAIDATRLNKDAVDMGSFEEAIDKITIGLKQNVVYSDRERKLTAYHEAGHALVGVLNPHSPRALHKITIGLRGMTLGVTHFRLKDEEYSYTKQEYEAMISIAMGGYIAEQMIFGKENVTSGASSDFQSANSIAKEMVTKYAMGDDNSFLVAPVVTLSEEAVNRNIEKILQRNYEVAKAILEKNKDKLIKLADTLLKEEILTYEQLEVLLGLPKKQDAQ